MAQARALTRENVPPTFSFHESVVEYSQHYAPLSPSVRHIQSPTRPESPWIMVSYQTPGQPEQGWKLHIAASQASAKRVLRRVLPILFAQEVAFKVLETQQDLAQLNSGSAGLSQIGKFITIYPLNDEEAVRLAVALDAATYGLPAPAIPSDRCLRQGSLVFYRYGSFQGETSQTNLGEYQIILRAPSGETVPDERSSTYSPPHWARDPFLAAGVAEEENSPPLLIANRYLLLTTLYQSAMSRVQLAVDLQMPRSCIVKRLGLGFVRGADKENDDIRARLSYEARVLAKLTPCPGLPTYYDLCEEHGETFLIMEDLGGETLGQYIGRLHARGQKLARTQVITWGQELADLLKGIHARGFVHHDLKSSNVLVTEDDRLHLIDYDIAQEIQQKEQGPGSGTPGYMSPQQQRGDPAAISDDIYSLGALCYFMATGAEPSLAPDRTNLLTRPPHLLNPGLDAPLIAIIERCLAAEPVVRFASTEEVAVAFAALPASVGPAPAAFVQEQLEPVALASHLLRYRHLAFRLGTTLAQAAQVGRGGRVWTSKPYAGKGMQTRDLSAGNSGSLLALAELVDEFADPQQHCILAEGANWLAASRHPGDKTLPGLYIGEAGVSAALLRAGQVLDNAPLIARAIERSRWIAVQPFRSPDLFNGTAGRIRLHLWLWDVTADPEQLRMAVQAGNALLGTAQAITPDEICWTIPPDYGSMSGSAYLGYAHGAAGIADVLLDLYESSQQENFLMAALGAGRWLQKQAVPVLEDKSGLDWPTVEGEHPRGAFWCHGATGIGIFFLHMARLDLASEAATIAERAAQAVAYDNRACSPIQCHGLAGNIDFLLDMAQATGQASYLASAFELASLLEAFLVEKDGELTCSSESPDIFTPDYLTGYAGTAMTLLRLANPQRPRQLSRAGLGYRARAYTISSQQQTQVVFPGQQERETR